MKFHTGRLITLIAPVLVSVAGPYSTAYAEQKWIRCALTQKSDRGGEDPWRPMPSEYRTLVFDESSRSIAEYIGGDLIPGQNNQFSTREMSTNIRFTTIGVNRVTGETLFTLTTGSSIIDLRRGTCEPIAPMDVLKPRF